jgi:hypothetical protein
LAGTNLDETFGVNLTGLFALDFPFHSENEEMISEFDRAVAERRPIQGSHCIETTDHRRVEFDWMVTPVANDVVDEAAYLLGAVEFRCAPHCAGGRPLRSSLGHGEHRSLRDPSVELELWRHHNW